jgi:hypothetical protein
VFPEESTAVTVTLTDAPEVEAIGALTAKVTLCAHAAGSKKATATATPTSLAAAIKWKRIGCVMQLDTVSIAPESMIQSRRAPDRVTILLRLFT